MRSSNSQTKIVGNTLKVKKECVWLEDVLSGRNPALFSRCLFHVHSHRTVWHRPCCHWGHTICQISVELFQGKKKSYEWKLYDCPLHPRGCPSSALGCQRSAPETTALRSGSGKSFKQQSDGVTGTHRVRDSCVEDGLGAGEVGTPHWSLRVAWTRALERGMERRKQ